MGTAWVPILDYDFIPVGVAKNYDFILAKQTGCFRRSSSPRNPS